MNRDNRSQVRGFQSIVFDCDSTLASIEGIDELARSRSDEIRALTDAAMDGSIPLEQVYGLRLEIIRPSREQVEALGSLYVDSLVTDCRETVAALLWLGKDVRIISGGLRPPLEAVAAELGIPLESVAAVGIQFGDDGSYAGFETRSLLARTGGKPRVLRDWGLSRPSLMVGDGATDLEAMPEVDLFAAYMGVTYRPAVAAAADLVLTGRSLAPVLAIAADSDDRKRLAGSAWESILAKGDSMLHDDG
jgi:phosphoserine phosphatase